MNKKEINIEEIKDFLIKNFSEESDFSVIDEMLIKSREYCKICPNDGLGWISLATFLQKEINLQKIFLLQKKLWSHIEIILKLIKVIL